jgi:hypothetical protein
MNWRKIDEAWRKFAESHSRELNLSDKPYLGGTRTSYLIKFTDEIGTTVYSGLINKSTSGYILYKMNVETITNDVTRFQEKVVKRKNRLAWIFGSSSSSKDILTQTIEQSLNHINAVKVITSPKMLRIEFDTMPTNERDLEIIEKKRVELVRRASR